MAELLSAQLQLKPAFMSRRGYETASSKLASQPQLGSELCEKKDRLHPAFTPAASGPNEHQPKIISRGSSA
jgi:hypothetical protein